MHNMNQILLIAPTVNATQIPVVLDLRQRSGAEVTSVFSESGGNRVRILVLIGGSLHLVAEISPTNSTAPLQGGEIYLVTKDATPEAAGVFATLGSDATTPSGGTAVEWSGP